MSQWAIVIAALIDYAVALLGALTLAAALALGLYLIFSSGGDA